MSQDRKTWKIHGQKSLKGSVRVQGNKNSALPCMAASLLLTKVGQHITLKHVPRIRDVHVLSEILDHLGITTVWRSDNLTLTRTKSFPRAVAIPKDVISRIRGSIILLGPLAVHWKQFTLFKPGGDKIGTRPITAHITALQDLGFSVQDRKGVLTVQRKTVPSAKHTRVWLTEQSVTATEIVLMASASLKKTSLTIQDAATEPHIVTLCRLLVLLGAKIDGLGSSLLTISWPKGVRQPRASIRLDDDFMEAATLAVAVAVTRGKVDIHYQNPADLELMDRTIRWMGVDTELDQKGRIWRILGSRRGLKMDPALQVLKAEPWPRFHTDIMSLFVVLATQSKGILKFIEYMYNDRFGFVQALRDMGARIRIEGPHVIVVDGGSKLQGNEMLLRPDIRSGAAMLLAALGAQGISVLHDRKGVISRGYEDLPGKLKSLGADIEEIERLFE